jgi:hypothetical protein
MSHAVEQLQQLSCRSRPFLRQRSRLEAGNGSKRMKSEGEAKWALMGSRPEQEVVDSWGLLCSKGRRKAAKDKQTA